MRLPRRRRGLTKTLGIWLLNADNYRKVGVVEELTTIAAYKPAVIGIVEALGNPLPDLDGYVLISDGSNDSRGNIATYVRSDLNPSHVQWHDMRRGWPRTKYAGQHEPRSFVTFRIGGRVRVIVAHQPPPGATRASKIEHLAALTRVLNRNPLWPVVLLWDSNGAAKTLAAVTRCTIYGRRVDNALGRGLLEGRWFYLNQWARHDGRGVVRFGGDHRHVWRGSFAVPSKWITLTPSKEK